MSWGDCGGRVTELVCERMAWGVDVGLCMGSVLGR